MTGPEHYKEAERLLSQTRFWRHGAPSFPDGTPMPEATRDVLLARAQVHATLALAAASALTTVREFFELDQDAEEWCRAVAEPRTEPAAEDESYCNQEHQFGACTRAKGHDGDCNSERMPF